MKRTAWMMLALGTFTVAALPAADKVMASGFAKSAAKMAEDKKYDRAKDFCYLALANDDTNPDALFELGKILQMEKQDTLAAEFFVKAAQNYGREEAANPALAAKRQDAERRARELNPHAAKLVDHLASYTQDLNAITKKVPDSLTLEEACDRVDALKLRTLLPPGKGPAFERPAAAVATTTNNGGSRSPLNRNTTPAPATPLAPDVERALKSAGWTKITGSWKKKAENVYEVTDGKLEVDKTNGALGLVVHKEGLTGSVKMMVRNSMTDDDSFSTSSSYYSYSSGFGYIINKDATRLYTPSGGFSGGRFYSYMEREDSLPEGPKVQFIVTVQDGKLEYYVNNAPKKKTGQNNITKTGPMVIEVRGTATIELPRAQ